MIAAPVLAARQGTRIGAELGRLVTLDLLEGAVSHLELFRSEQKAAIASPAAV